jgi:hypothetical protein
MPLAPYVNYIVLKRTTVLESENGSTTSKAAPSPVISNKSTTSSSKASHGKVPRSVKIRNRVVLTSVLVLLVYLCFLQGNPASFLEKIRSSLDSLLNKPILDGLIPGMILPSFKWRLVVLCFFEKLLKDLDVYFS